MLLLEDSINKIICADCLKVMRQISNGRIDLIVTSPPYNLKNSSGRKMGVGGNGQTLP